MLCLDKFDYDIFDYYDGPKSGVIKIGKKKYWFLFCYENSEIEFFAVYKLNLKHKLLLFYTRFFRYTPFPFSYWARRKYLDDIFYHKMRKNKPVGFLRGPY